MRGERVDREVRWSRKMVVVKVVAWGGVVVRKGWWEVDRWCEGEKAEAWVEVLAVAVVESECW